MSEKPEKRLVSRTEYAIRKTLAMSLSVGLGALWIGGLYFLYGLPNFLYAKNFNPALCSGMDSDPCHRMPSAEELAPWCYSIFITLVLGTILLCLGSRKSWRSVRTLQPVNFADTTALLAFETLVRPSDLPPSHQQAELLRGVMPGNETAPEELLRAMTNRNNGLE